MPAREVQVDRYTVYGHDLPRSPIIVGPHATYLRWNRASYVEIKFRVPQRGMTVELPPREDVTVTYRRPLLGRSFYAILDGPRVRQLVASVTTTKGAPNRVNEFMIPVRQFARRAKLKRG